MFKLLFINWNYVKLFLFLISITIFDILSVFDIIEYMALFATSCMNVKLLLK